MRTLFAIFVFLNALLVVLLMIQFGVFAPRIALHIASAPEHRPLEPLILDWAADNKADVTISYVPPAAIAQELGEGTRGQYDAVWPASSLWIALGDTKSVVRHQTPILRTPVVLGLRMSAAIQLGWIGRDDITIEEIRQAANDGKFHLSMPQATQSSAGAAAYFGFLHALADEEGGLTIETLDDTAYLDKVQAVLAEMDRVSGSSGWLTETVVAHYETLDAMFNYESAVIEANRLLAELGQEPLYAIYPAGGAPMADSPLGFLIGGDEAKEAKFLELQEMLLSKDAQETVIGMGYRTVSDGPGIRDPQADALQKTWGIDISRAVTPLPLPSADLIGKALDLYRTELRRPSLTVWLLDVSDNMAGTSMTLLKNAMAGVLDPDAALAQLQQPSSRDVTIVLPFNLNIQDPIVIEGDNRTAAERALRFVNNLKAGGGTDVYYALYEAMEAMRPYVDEDGLGDYLPAIIALNAGPSVTDNRAPLLAHIDQTPYTQTVPIHTIAFGKFDTGQLDELSRMSMGRAVTIEDDLTGAMIAAKGYN